MQRNTTWWRYLHFWRHRPERDVDDELRAHLELRTADLEQLGLTPGEARRQALEEFGDLETTRAGLYEISRRVSRHRERFLWLDGLRADLRHALRGLIASPILAGAIVFTLAAGIGAMAVTYGAMRQLLLRPPPHVVAPERLVRFFFTWDNPGEPPSASAGAGFRLLQAVRSSDTALYELAGYEPDREVPIGRGVDARLGRATLVSDGFWRLLGVRPLLGRFNTDDEAHPVTGDRVVVLGHAFWRRYFGGDRGVAGRTIELRGMPYEIIGVAPRGFRGIEITESDLWLPLRAHDDGARGPNWRTDDVPQRIVARLRPDVSEAVVEARASNFYATFMRREHREGPKWGVKLAGVTGALDAAMTPLPETRLSLWLFVIAGILLAVACANVSGLLLLRALRRRREFAVRLALGMSRRRLATLLLVEGFVLASVGGLAAAAVVALAGPWLRGTLLDGMALESAGTDWNVVVLAAACVIGAAVMAGLAPLMQLRDDPVAGLRDGGSHGMTRRSAVFRTLLVGQTALSVVLLIGAGLFVRSMHRIAQLDHGLDVHRVLTVEADFTGTGRTAAERAAFFERALERARAVPGVQHASIARYIPLRGAQGGGVFRLPGSERYLEPDRRAPRVNFVGSDFFAATGMRVIAGRDFAASDRSGNGPIVVNERLARFAWPGRSPVGECVYLSATPDACTPVVGVVADARTFSIREELRYWFYRPLPAGDTTASRVLLARVAAGGAGVEIALRRALHELDPALPYVSVRRLGEALDPQIRPWRVGMAVFTAFGLLAAILASVGLYAAVAYAVSQRSREIGVRMVVGATKRQVIGLVLGDGCRTSVAGIVFGLLIGVAAGPLIADQLFDVSPRDPMVLGVVGVAVLAVALMASFEPARRAAAVEPMTALRNE
ncbi:MAG TPA: ADOP family duplicated permease [Gemmatimonadaceae bacterium]|nr:ADOP family duplicated permease [Gemmatimonadaceae bacterium]